MSAILRRPFTALSQQLYKRPLIIPAQISLPASWRLLEASRIPEFDIEAVVLEHCNTRAQYLHMAAADANNVFNVSFRTTPMDSTGVAHILEHTTLCGSHKYPVRDPFMKMLNRSLATFMNAMTAPDHTMYPFSTCNDQDFFNLMSVYMDAVFCPLLRELDFLQEGWRLENEELDDKTSPFIIKGVVYNEMKGAFSDSQYMFGQHLINNLLPSHTYRHSSGGLPIKIPDLTWEQLKKFHASHYHPSNARFYTYGNIPLERHLQNLDEYLQRFEYMPLHTAIPSEARWTAPRTFEISCAPDPMSSDPVKQATVAVSYLLSDISDTRECFVLQVLGDLLMNGPAAPLYKSLIEPGIGMGFSPVSGYYNSLKETSFTVGLQNIAATDVDRVVQIIEHTLARVVEEGFPQERIAAVLHSYELGLKHRSGNFGLNLVLGMTSYWNHADGPLDYLKVNQTLDWFNSELKKDSKFLQKMVRKHFIDNKHKLIQSMRPDSEFPAKEQAAYDQLEEELRRKMTEEDQRQARTKALDLLKLQSEPEDAVCLPSLKVRDIPKEFPLTTLSHTRLGGVATQISIQPTNQVSYFRALIDTSCVPLDLKPYLPLFTSFLSKLGAKHLNYQALDTQIELTTGGLAASCHIAENPTDLLGYSEHILLSSYCLDRNISNMFDLWSYIFEDLHLNDSQRVGTLVKMDATDTINGIAHAGHQYAMSSSAAGMTPASGLKELLSGMQHVSLLSQLSAQAEGGGAAQLLPKLQQLATMLLGSSSAAISCALNTTAKAEASFTTEAERFLGRFYSHPVEPVPAGSGRSSGSFVRPADEKLHHVVSFPINFTAMSVPTVPFAHHDYAALRVLAAMMSAKFLHQEIREKGGAYGGGAVAGAGSFTYYSYRDPKNLETFSVYRHAAEWASRANFTSQDVEEAKLRVFQKLDAPEQPGYRGLRPFLTGLDDAMFGEHRQRVKEVTEQQLVCVAERYLLDPSASGRTLVGPAQTGLDDLGWTVRKQ